jgi:hypothetical protein
MVCTYLLMIGPTVLFINNVASVWGPILVAASFLLLMIAVCAFSAAACSDPGIIFPPESESEECIEQEIDVETGESTAATLNGGSAVGTPHRNSGSSLVGRRRSQNTETAGTVECGICEIQRPYNASHCYECGVCVEDLDHHCPWTGKCIGKKNLQQFHFFLWSLATLILFVVCFVVATVVQGNSIFYIRNHFS